MRFSALVLGAAAALTTLGPSIAEDIKPEKVTPTTIPEDMKRVYLIDLAINHIIDGRAYILDEEKLEVKGLIELGFLGLLYAPPKSNKVYVASTYYDRLTRGKRADVITIFDASTLKPLDEIPISNKKVQPIQYRPLFTGSADGKFLYVQNATPATSITVVDIAKKTSAEIAAPGCYGTYPSIGNSSHVSTLCGDGTFGTYALNEAGTEGKRQASAKLFDADKDAWFIHGEKNGTNYNFVSFGGVVSTVNLDGDQAKLVDSFAIAQGVEGDWRPGGYQPIAVDPAKGIAYVLMHSKGTEGSHKNPGEEVWSVDLKAKKVVSRSKAPPMTSITIAADGSSLFGVNPLEASVVKLSVDSAKDYAVTQAATTKVGETASQIEVYN